MIRSKTMLARLGCLFCGLFCFLAAKTAAATVPDPIVDTGQTACYDNSRQISCPSKGEPFWGQDGNFLSNPPSYHDNGDGTVTDLVTGLMWIKNDSAHPMNWQQALEYAKNSRDAGYSDWRLPNAKELQYIVDYSRSPATTDSAAIDPVFQATPITNEAGQKDYGFYWTSTTHQDGRMDAGVYICFGRGIGMMRGRIMDVHGAGAQRSDPKTGNAYLGHGPQGDTVRVRNYVRLVRGSLVTPQFGIEETGQDRYPNKVRVLGISAGFAANSHRFQMEGQDRYGNQARQMEDGFQNSPRMRRGGMGGARFIKRLDRDGDNRVSRSEFDGPAEAFSHLDRNGDGYISEDEAPTGPPPRSRR